MPRVTAKAAPWLRGDLLHVSAPLRSGEQQLGVLVAGYSRRAVLEERWA